MNKLRKLLEILLVSFKLGLTSFGGPVAHLGYFHEEYVKRRKWIDDKSYADLIGLCQFLPGPASSQAGIGIGILRGGLLGGLAAFAGFTIPSAAAMILFALFLNHAHLGDAGWLHGLKITAAAVVAHAILGMGKNLAPDLLRKGIALFASVFILFVPSVFSQVIVIILAGITGYILLHTEKTASSDSYHFPVSKRTGVICLAIFILLLAGLPALSHTISNKWLSLFDSFYRSGSLVFGGGHVVLPLLEKEFVPAGLLTKEQFLAGYGAAQAVPGPLFTFASYIGAAIGGWRGGILATAAIFLPAFLLMIGALPFWQAFRQNDKMKSAISGINAAVIGILIAAFYQPIWMSSIIKPADFALAAVLFSLLSFWKLPPWAVVVAGIAGGILLPYIS
ncbi:chromate efflux transporter [Metabacillus sp. GX 13764]|uniref:chromate efflux transporter n=1 Tax=Metabacillus kandeliae TaxID=2900151 RepID=UPI001E2BD6AA|nr:chromate efflux transporter [Metabacillus kandeliae]MCD7035539.1 chromate efflux transporter [Metabacillus kandeliae]